NESKKDKSSKNDSKIDKSNEKNPKEPVFWSCGTDPPLTWSCDSDLKETFHTHICPENNGCYAYHNEGRKTTMCNKKCEEKHMFICQKPCDDRHYKDNVYPTN
ncbi:unnamed protein product, partial [Owenia fusiformis]